MEEMLAAIREAIHAHAASHEENESEVANAPPVPAEGKETLLAEEMPAGASAGGASGVAAHASSDDSMGGMQWASGELAQAGVEPLEEDDDAIEWQVGDAALASNAWEVAESAGNARLAARPEQTPQPQEASRSARVVPLAAHRGRGGAGQAPAAPATEGALALQTSVPSLQPRVSPAAESVPGSAPVVRLSEPVRGRVQQALGRLQVRERLEEVRQTPHGEEALREMLREMLQPLLEEWAREQLPELLHRQMRGEVREVVRREVAAELARLSAAGRSNF